MRCHHESLFSLIAADESIFHKIPTIAKMLPLFDAYTPDTRVTEKPTAIVQREIHDFIDALLDTPPMQIAMEFLHQKGSFARYPLSWPLCAFLLFILAVSFRNVSFIHYHC